MNMAKRPIPKYDFKAFGAAIKAARTGRKESRKKVSDEMSVDQFLLDKPAEKNTQRRQLDALLDGISETGLRIVAATAKEIAEVEKEDE